MSRVKDEDDPLNDEVRECNAFAPELALDIHVNAGGGDGFIWQAGTLNQAGFHAAFSTNPQNRVCLLTERLKDRQGGIHSAAGPPCADQQPHERYSFLQILCPIWIAWQY